MQEGPSGDPVIRKLFGLRLHKSLKAEEGEETIKVWPCVVACEAAGRAVCSQPAGRHATLGFQ